MITSLSNPKVKLLKRLLNEKRARRRERAFVAEGSRWIQEIVKTADSQAAVFATAAWCQKNQLLARMS